MCDCGAETETTTLFFLRCQIFANEKQKLHNNVYRIDTSIKNLNEVSRRYNDRKNKQILLHTICYVQSTKRFERPLIDQC